MARLLYRRRLVEDYYAHLEHLRGRLVGAGQDHWAVELLSAERSASTSGEALASTAVVLRRLLSADEPELEEFRQEVQSIYDEGGAIWNRRT